MKNLTPLWPPKWWYVGPIARRKEDILLAGTVALFIITPFFCSGSRQARIASVDRRVRTFLTVNQIGKPATELEMRQVQRAPSFTIESKPGKPDLYVLMTPSTPLPPFCVLHKGPSFVGYNVHILPLSGSSPRDKAVALALFDKPSSYRNQLDLMFTLSLDNRSISPKDINKAWDGLKTLQMKTIQSAWTENKKILDSNPEYPIYAVVGDKAYKLKDWTIPSRVLKDLRELSR